MLEILKFIFQGFWHWLGFAILLGIVAHGLGNMLSIRVKRTEITDAFNDDEK